MKNKEKMEIVAEGVDSVSDVLTYLDPVFAALPIITFAVKRVFGLLQPDDIVERIKKIEKKLERNKISIDTFKEKVNNLCEHDRYVFSNNLNNIIIDCIPETVDIYISILIDMIMKDKEKNKQEELCDIIKQLNANDLNALEMIKKYRENGVRDCYNERTKEQYESNNQKLKIYGNKVIFWEDFSNTFDLNVTDLEIPILFRETNAKRDDFCFLIKSFIKLEKLGILIIRYCTTIGSSTFLNIDSIDTSMFGDMLLNYVDIDLSN